MARSEKHRKLTVEEQGFVAEFVKTADQNNSFRVAFPDRSSKLKPHAFECAASDLINSPRIQAELAKIKAAIAREVVLEKKDIIRRLITLADDQSQFTRDRLEAMQKIINCLGFEAPKGLQISAGVDNAAADNCAALLLSLREQAPELFAKRVKAIEARSTESKTITQQETEDA